MLNIVSYVIDHFAEVQILNLTPQFLWVNLVKLSKITPLVQNMAGALVRACFVCRANKPEMTTSCLRYG
jgi:hypothetical protein